MKLSLPAIDWSSKSVQEKVARFIELQTFEGSWTFDVEVFSIMGLGEGQSEGVKRQDGVDKHVWVTLLVVKWLEIMAGEEEGVDQIGQSCVIAGYTAGRGRRTNQLGALILAVLDGTDVDSGTAAEIGYAFAKGKPILGYRGDFRLSADNDGSTVNLQVEYFIRQSGGDIVASIKELGPALAKIKAAGLKRPL